MSEATCVINAAVHVPLGAMERMLEIRAAIESDLGFMEETLVLPLNGKGADA
jgi:hypothetical protein